MNAYPIIKAADEREFYTTAHSTIKASRIIVRQQGVGLSMLRNVKNNLIKTKYLRNNKALESIIVT